MRRIVTAAVVLLLLAGAVFAGMKILDAPTPGKNSTTTGHAHGHGDGEKEHAHDDDGVTMSDAKVLAAGIELEKVQPGTLRDVLRLNGILQANQEQTVQITPRFPGIVREVKKRVGDAVQKNEVVATIESNQSLTLYELRAPISGTVIDRQVSLGEYASEQKPAFTVSDLSTVWVDLAVPRRDFRRVKVGDAVMIDVEDGGPPVNANISYVSPIGAAETQSALARATAANAGGRLRPGLFVTARLILSEKKAPLVIKLSALQMLEKRNVVFARAGDRFEAREVELGDKDGEHAEVLFGLSEGDVYATRNSFVIKAEIGKGSAAHEH
ncbi:hemolysin D [Bradyrhizobium jicamae]|uniref:Hemolysin D n=1 Tax=Bradyrhizobium jicamae TaxID=280332 RepID=A0A0R3L8M7_9BRAD|nr:efflux RND transporter periplasmic adaptor subunit [Bradyrhizobium jicamae]KRR01983.1 hemolysin D [Bradyrhizobium jicamae]